MRKKMKTLLTSLSSYRKNPKILDTPKYCCNYPEVWTMWFYPKVMHPKEEDGMANSVDPDQTAPGGAVWSGSTMFVLDLSIRKTQDHYSCLSSYCINTAFLGNHQDIKKKSPRKPAILFSSKSTKLHQISIKCFTFGVHQTMSLQIFFNLFFSGLQLFLKLNHITDCTFQNFFTTKRSNSSIFH